MKESINFEMVNNLKDRTKKFALMIIKISRMLPNNGEGRLIRGQLLRCGTSVGSNYRAACRGRSDKEFYAKLCIVVEEADETVFWLEILRDAKILSAKKVTPVLNEAEEILSIMASSRKTAGRRLKK